MMLRCFHASLMMPRARRLRVTLPATLSMRLLPLLPLPDFTIAAFATPAERFSLRRYYADSYAMPRAAMPLT